MTRMVSTSPTRSGIFPKRYGDEGDSLIPVASPRLQLPNIAVVFFHGAVGGEEAAAGRIEDAHAGPMFLILPRDGDVFLRIHVAAEIRQRHPRVAGAHQRIQYHVKNARFVQAT